MKRVIILALCCILLIGSSYGDEGAKDQKEPAQEEKDPMLMNTDDFDSSIPIT